MSTGRTVAVWTEVTGCGTRTETLTADGQVHIHIRPPLGEPEFDGEDDPDPRPTGRSGHSPAGT